MVHLENLLKIFLQDVLKRSWKRLEEVLKRSWKRLEDIWLRQIYWFSPRCLEGVLKTSYEDVRPRRSYSSWSRRLEDIFRTRRRKMPSRRLQDVLIKTNVCWEMVNINDTCSAWSNTLFETPKTSIHDSPLNNIICDLLFFLSESNIANYADGKYFLLT